MNKRARGDVGVVSVADRWRRILQGKTGKMARTYFAGQAACLR